MPRGQSQVRWTAENQTKLLLAILAVHNIKVDNNEVAKAFGDNVPGKAISNQLVTLRKQAAALGLTPSKKVPATVKASTRAPGVSKPTQRRKAGGMLNDEADDDESMTSETNSGDHKRYRTALATPSRQMSIAGQITKPRVSPRGLPKKDYNALENPYTGGEALDADGQPIFEESELEDDEDGSNDDYEMGDGMVNAAEEPVAVKMEQEAETS